MIHRILTEVETTDPGRLAESLTLLPDQLAAGWNAAGSLKLPSGLSAVDSILVAGMGGSHLGPRIAASVFDSQLKKSIVVHSDYGLPGWVGRRTLVVASSYSGGTEETLSAYAEAGKRGAHRVVLAGGGTLAAAAKRDLIPAIVFPTETNPSGQPRFGVGLSFGAFTHLLQRIGALPSSHVTSAKLVAGGRSATLKARGWANPTAKMLVGKVPVLIGAEHLIGNLGAAANQFNENAKTVALWFPLPDLNHHLLEGLSQPKDVIRKLTVIGFDSAQYRAQNRKRLALTLGIFKKQGAKTLNVRPVGSSLLDEALFVLAWSGAVSVELAQKTKQKAHEIPWVEYFKEQLAK